MKSKKILISFLAMALIAIAIYSIYYVNHTFKKIKFSPCQFEESSNILKNPYCGFYHLYGFTLTDDDTSKAQKLSDTINDDSNSLALLEINLKNFSSRNLSNEALSQLNTILSSCENSNKKLIIRFLYDWDGKAKSTEPSDISQILSHMDAVAPCINSYKNTVYILQGIFVGNCGEMNNSVYMSTENMLTLINHLDECIDKDIFLAVRTPAHYRIINDSVNPVKSDKAYTGSLQARLGLFNDGMLGSDTDLGTYGTSSFDGSANPSDKGTRQEEIEFQNELCNFVPNGGECVVDNSFNDFYNAIEDLNNMHVSYLNCDYDAAVLDKWKNTIYEGNDVFNNMNGYDYISAHLGYRYFIKTASLNYNRFKSHNATLTIIMENTGFSPAYKKFECKILLVRTNTKEFPINYDNRFLSGGDTTSMSVDIDTASLETGTYDIYFVMSDTSSNIKTKISLANTSYSEEDGLLIGRLSVN